MNVFRFCSTISIYGVPIVSGGIIVLLERGPRILEMFYILGASQFILAKVARDTEDVPGIKSHKRNLESS